MDIEELLQEWEKSGELKIAAREYRLRLPVRDAARIAALAEMYPLKSENDIIAGLLSVALDAIEKAFPYVQGSKVIAEDEFGDPIYEDVGLTPRFLAFSKEHADLLMAENNKR
jgi:glutamate dehydrogenase/leucine dehydrogenase